MILDLGDRRNREVELRGCVLVCYRAWPVKAGGWVATVRERCEPDLMWLEAVGTTETQAVEGLLAQARATIGAPVVLKRDETPRSPGGREAPAGYRSLDRDSGGFLVRPGRRRDACA